MIANAARLSQCRPIPTSVFPRFAVEKNADERRTVKSVKLP